MKVFGLVVPWLLMALACRPARVETSVMEFPPATVVELARTRLIADPTKARFSVKLRSEPLDLAGSTTGGLLLDRPGRGRIELFGPLGGTLATVLSDGVALSVVIVGKKRHLVAADAEAILRDMTGGVAGLDDLLALLVGDLPFKHATPRSVERLPPEGDVPPGVRLVLDGPKGTAVEVVLDSSQATPRRVIATDGEGKALLSADYGPFEPALGSLMPTSVEVQVPGIDLTVAVTYRSWEPLGDFPTAFVLHVPSDFETESLETVLRNIVEKVPAR